MSLPVAGVLVDDQWYVDAWSLAVELRSQGESAASDLVHGWLENAREQEEAGRKAALIIAEPAHPWWLDRKGG